MWICPEPDGHIQATARDARGRKQYRTTPTYREACDRSKFRRMLEFSETLPRLREKIERDLRGHELSRRQIIATVIRLLDRTLIRVGNDEYARQNRSFGLTTLRRRHVEVKGTVLRFSFRGKSGIEHDVSLADRRLARIVQRCRTCLAPRSSSLRHLRRRQPVASDDVNERLREIARARHHREGFPHLGGTMHAALALRAMGPATTQREADRNIVRAIDQVGRAPRQHARGLPQVLRAPSAHRGVPRGADRGVPGGDVTNGERRDGRGGAAARRGRGAAVPARRARLKRAAPARA